MGKICGMLIGQGKGKHRSFLLLVLHFVTFSLSPSLIVNFPDVSKIVLAMHPVEVPNRVGNRDFCLKASVAEGSGGFHTTNVMIRLLFMWGD